MKKTFLTDFLEEQPKKELGFYIYDYGVTQRLLEKYKPTNGDSVYKYSDKNIKVRKQGKTS